MKPRTDYELKLMRKSGEISAKALKKAILASKVGVSLKEIDEIAEKEIRDLGGKPSFMTEPGYKWTTCLTVNNEVVHGIPREHIILKKGDLLSIDIGAIYKGWHTDTAWSLIVGGGSTPFLEAGEKAMWAGVAQAIAGNKIGDISSAIQKEIETPGFSVVKSLVGHGVGRSLHEDPLIPGIGKPDTGLKLKAGMTLAIESIYTENRPEVMLEQDGWTIVTRDGSLGGLFEMSVIVLEGKVEVLTDWRKY